jgi:hypothetical protein
MSAPEVDRWVGPEQGRLILHASRHDLTIEMTRWPGRLRAGVNPAVSELTGTVDMGSTRIADGTGGIKPLSELDERAILQNARKILSVDRYPSGQPVRPAAARR